MRLRIILLALPLSAWSALATLPGRGALVMPTEPGWEEWVASDGFGAWIRITLNAQVWLAVGLAGWYAALSNVAPRWRFWGLASWFAGTLVYLPLLGLMGWGWPHMDATAAAASMDSMAVTWIVFATITSIVGMLLLAWGLRRHDKLVAGGLVLGALAYVPGPWWLEFAGTAALAVAFSLVAWNAWVGRRAATPPA